MFGLKRFSADRAANVTTIFALALVPLIGFVSLSIDYSRASAANDRLQVLLDGAVLAGASLPGSTPTEEVNEHVKKMLEATSSDDPLLKDLVFSVDVDAMTVGARADGNIASTFAKLLGLNQIQVASISRAQRPRTKKADIALVLDNTGSMNEPAGGGLSKLEALKLAVSGTAIDPSDGLTGLLRTAFASRPGDVRLSVIPFSLGVMVPNVSPAMASLIEPEPPAGSSVCVTDRPGNRDLKGLPPTAADAASRFRRKRKNNSWVACPQPPVNGGIAALNSDLNDVDARVFAMVADGWTNAPVGLFWGRQSIVPGGLLPGGAPSTELDLTRYLILLTDGDNTRSFEHEQGSANDNPAPIDDKMLAMCESIRTDDKVVVYTIGFGAGISAAAKSKLATCAGSPDRAKLAANAGDLNLVFSEIAADVAKTRLLK